MRLKLFISSKKPLILIIIFIVYTVFVLLNLTKEPFVFFDEVFFANIAHYSLDRNDFSEPSRPFSGQLSAPGKLSLVMHPPIYPWLIAVTTHFFGFNIYTVRLTSFWIGLLLLPFFFSILGKIINNDTLTLSLLFLFTSDQAFIHCSKFGRPDILFTFFTTLSLLFYIKTLEEDNTKNYFFTGLFSGFSFMTHLALGLIPLVLTNLHFILTKRFKRLGFKKLLFLAMPSLTFFILWLVFIILPIFLHNSGLFKDTLSLFLKRLLGNSKDFYFVLRSFIRGSGFAQARFYIYITLLFPLIFLLRNKNGIKSFLLLAYLFTYLYMLLIGLVWYTILFTLIACLAFGCLIKEKNKYQRLPIVLLIIAISCNIATQIQIIKIGLFLPSYEDYSKQLSNYLPIGAKVFIVDSCPDPYFYFASHRKDLRLEFPYISLNGDREKEAIKTADCIIIGHITKNRYRKDYEFLIPYALSYSQSYVYSDEWDLAIFNMKRIT